MIKEDLLRFLQSFIRIISIISDLFSAITASSSIS